MARKKRIASAVRPALPPFAARYQRQILVVLCAVAAVRLLFHIAALPFFTNVDEESHFDTVVKYSHGQIPKGIERFSSESIERITWYSTPEFMWDTDKIRQSGVKPIWELPKEQKELALKETKAHWAAEQNHETIGPPVYYLLAGVWYNLGKALHLRPLVQLYWLRMLNIPIYLLLMLIASAFVGRLYPKDPTLRMCVLIILAFLPQDLYYSISNDVLSAPIFALSLLGMYSIYQSPGKSYVYYGLVGVFIAAALLTKLTNIPIILPLATIVYLTLKRAEDRRDLVAMAGKQALMLGLIVIPIGIWCGRNWINMHSLTGTPQLVEFMGWTPKPLSAMWSHPIFTHKGFIAFLQMLLSNYWKGEIT